MLNFEPFKENIVTINYNNDTENNNSKVIIAANIY